MWGARGARLWRSLERAGRGGGRGSRESSWEAVEASMRNLSVEARTGSNVVAREVLKSVGGSQAGAGLLAGRCRGWQQLGDELSGASHPQKTVHMLQQQMGIMTKAESLQAASDVGEQPVRSPLSQAPGPVGAAEGVSKTAIGTKKESQAVLTYIKQSPKKVNLVAELVRGMRVDDALMQMAVSTKRAAKVVAKVMTSARANAVHNHGLDKDRLIVSEAFVGKDKYLKRLRIHGKGKAGKMVRPRCRLTIILKELSPEKEAELARLRVQRFHGRKIRGSNAKLVPHRVVRTQWQWSRKPARGENPPPPQAAHY